MKNSKKVFAVHLLLVIILLIVSIIIYYFNNNLPKNISNKEVVKTVSSTTSNSANFYDGTYTGTFNYEYMEKNRFGGEIITPWTTGSFNMTLDLKSLNKLSPNDTNPYIQLDAYNVKISDPVFNTEDGFDAVTSFGGQISFLLPANPEKQDSKDASIQLYFPGANYSTRYIEVDNGGIQVSSDGKIISINPNFDSIYNTDKTKRAKPAWKAYTQGLNTTFSNSGTTKGNIVLDRIFKYGNWSLMKIAN